MKSRELVSWVTCHWPAVGSVEVRTLPPELPWPRPETATQSEVEGHDTPARWVGVPWATLALVIDQAPAAPVGLSETSMAPSEPTATQRSGEAQDTDTARRLWEISERQCAVRSSARQKQTD